MGNDHHNDERQSEGLAEALCVLACAIREGVEQRKTEFEWTKSHHGFATKHDLDQVERTIMSAISDFVAKQNAFNDRIDTAIAGVTQDVQTLNDLIKTLQNSPGTITPEDQASLDALQTRGQAVADKLEALDALTPPPAPPVT